MIATYPAIIEKADDCFFVNFVDIKNAFTFGNSVEQAIENARDVLGLMLYDAKNLPAKSDIKDIALNSDDILVSVSVDLDEYSKFMQNRIKYTREKKGLSCADVATLFGGEEEQVEKWEKQPPEIWLQNLVIDEIEAYG